MEIAEKTKVVNHPRSKKEDNFLSKKDDIRDLAKLAREINNNASVKTK